MGAIRKTCYCEIGFLETFLSSRPTTLEPNDESILFMNNWTSLYCFISKSDLVLNISSIEFDKIKEKNEWLKMLWKKSSNGECGLDFVGNNSFPDITNLKLSNNEDKLLNAVFLTSHDDSICRRQSKLYGVIVLNVNLLKKCKHIFIDNGIEIPNTKIKNWDFLRNMNNLFPPLNICNSMVIVDNYLFADDIGKGGDERLKYNLEPILRAVLPEKLEDGECFELAIFTGERKDEFSNKLSGGYGTHYNYVCSLISRLRPKLNYRICFYSKAQNDFHDRSILTNNIWISSGHGFDIFRKSGAVDKPTTINVAFPFIQSTLLWCDGSYKNVLLKAYKICDSYIKEGINYWGGERSNRLISNYSQSIQKKTTDNGLQSFKAGTTIDLSLLPDFGKWGTKRF